MSQFNVGEVNQANQFNASLENAREQFYMNMQYAVDSANAKWRQTVTLTNSEMEFQAAATDVKNMLGLTTEALNQLWDRSDSLLDYAWKEGENEKDREHRLELAKMELAAAKKQAKSSMLGSLFKAAGTVAAAAIASDMRLKDNIQKYGNLSDGTNLYTWDWTDEAKDKGFGETPTYGVIAQELQKKNSEAVTRGTDGYLRVDYNKVKA